MPASRISFFFGTLAVLFIFIATPAHAQTRDELLVQLAELQVQLQSLLAQMNGSINVTVTTFDHDLQLGDEDPDVLLLQRVLNTNPQTKVAEQGPGAPGAETSYFGSLTHAAVLKFQSAYRSQILTPLNLVSPTGFVGPATRAVLNSLRHRISGIGSADTTTKEDTEEDEDTRTTERSGDTTTDLGAPSGFHTSISPTQVRIFWDEVAGATEYRIERSKNNTDNFETLDTITSTAYADTAINDNTTYYYVIVALNDDTSARSEARRVQTPRRSSGGCGISAPGYDIYVDSETGSDANDGTGPCKAFATLSAAQTAALAHGNGVKIGLARGSHWREDLVISNLSSVTLLAYGSGALPLVDGSVEINNNVFAKTDGQAAVYEVDVEQTAWGGYISVWEDGTMLQYVDNLATVNSTAGSFHVTNIGEDGKTYEGTHTVYIHSSDSSAITTNGKMYEITDPSRDGKVGLGNNATVRHIHTRRNFHADGSLTAGHDSHIYGSLFEDGVKHNSLVSSGTYERSVAWGSENGVRTGAILMEFFSLNGVGFDVSYRDAIAVCHRVTSGTGVDAFGGHNSGAGTYYATWTYEDSVASNCNGGFGGEAEVVAATRIYSHENETGAMLTSHSASTTITDMKLYNDDRPLLRGITTQNTNGREIEGLRAYVANVVADNSIIFGGRAALNRSVVYVAGLSGNWYALFGNIAGGAWISMDGTIIQNESGSNQLNLWEWYTVGAGVLDVLQNNVYWPNNRTRAVIDSNGYTNATDYLAALQGDGKESGSVATDPALANPASGDFTANGDNVPEGAGLERPNVTYHSIPATLSEALEFVDQ